MDARGEGQPGHTPELSSSTPLIQHAENRMSWFSLTREPLSHRLGLRAFLFEDFPLRLKPVTKGTLADASFVDTVGSH